MKNIGLQKNDEWVNRDTRAACKYSPVIVDKQQTPEAIEYMRDVLKRRIDACRGMAAIRHPDLSSASWFSFIRGGATYERWGPGNVPVIVLSGGSASKLQSELSKNYNLAWHPMNVRSEPIYLLVHKLEYNTYARALRLTLATYRNLHLTGWDGGQLTGFGAARAAALALADTLPYRPKRIIMMDQDVVLSTKVHLPQYGVGSKVEHAHVARGKQVIGLGVGYPERTPDIQLNALRKAMLQNKVTKPPLQDFNSPAQQAVSITAPFRKRANMMSDGAYPAYMVAGGEDMLMGMQLKLDNDLDPVNKGPLMNGPIIKKGLSGPNDPGKNLHWAGLRVEMLDRLYKLEKDTLVQWREPNIQLREPTIDANLTVEELLKWFVRWGWLAVDGSEFANTSALIIERIILRLHKLGQFPADVDQRVFNRIPNSK